MIDKISYRTWAVLLLLYFGMVLLRCGLGVYGVVADKGELIDVTHVLNKEPTLLFVPISFVLLAFSTYYFLTRRLLVERMLFLILVIVSFLSLSRMVISYSDLWLFIINYTILFLLLTSLLLLYDVYKKRSSKGGKGE